MSLLAHSPLFFKYEAHQTSACNITQGIVKSWNFFIHAYLMYLDFCRFLSRSAKIFESKVWVHGKIRKNLIKSQSLWFGLLQGERALLGVPEYVHAFENPSKWDIHRVKKYC